MARLLDERLMRALSRLRLDAKAPALGLYKGESESARRGSSVEFREYREYEPGDDYRHIDWNIYARLDRLVVKLFSEERNRGLDLLVDTSTSMAMGSPRKDEYAQGLAAALGFVALYGGDEVRIGALASSLTWHSPWQRGRERLPSLLRALGRLETGGLSELAQALRERGARVRSELTVLISDLLTPGWDEALDALAHSGGASVLIQLMSPEDRRPGLGGAYQLIDAETGEALEAHLDDDALAAYERVVEGFLDEVRRRAHQLGIACFQVETSYPLADLLLKSFRKGGLLR